MRYFFLLATIATTLQAATVTLEWDLRPADEEISEYRIYQLVGTNATLVATVPGSTNRASFQMEPGKYVFIGRSVNFWGESANSNEAKTPPLPNPPVLVTNLVTVSAVTDASGNRFLVSVQRQ